jgi:N6-L-threonylcarbamoyladenine synthase
VRGYTILAIDTSCDETSAAVTVDDRIFANVISSQVELHKKYGGVVPYLAKRAHQERIEPVILEAVVRFARIARLNRDGRGSSLDKYFREIDAVAVTYGPGLAPALEVGIAKAKELVWKYKKALIAVNHMEGHLLSSFAKNSKGKNPGLERGLGLSFLKAFRPGPSLTDLTERNPFLGLLVSGGHTQLVLMEKVGSYRLLGETLDDAGGEAFDKVAKILNLGYPGGPIIERLAKSGDEDSYPLPVPMAERAGFNFSFSGLKTAVLYLVRDLKAQGEFNKKVIEDVCASFQKAVALSLINKLEVAVKKTSPRAILLGGGVIANLYLRRKIRQSMRQFDLPILVPFEKRLFTDNAAMIGVCAYYQAKRNDLVADVDKLDRVPNLCF